VRLVYSETQQRLNAFVLALRKDNKVEIYYNYRRTTVMKNEYSDIDASFTQAYLRSCEKREDTGDDVLYKIEFKWKAMMGDNTREDLALKSDSHEFWAKNCHYAIRNHVSLYNCLCELNAFFLISHDRFVSIYHLGTKTWSHIMMNDRVLALAPNPPVDGSSLYTTERAYCLTGMGNLTYFDFSMEFDF
jgi:hypothetical protein